MKRAETDLRRTQEALYETALPCTGFPAEGRHNSRKTVIRKVLDKLAGSHPGNDNIVERATEDLRTATEFVRAQASSRSRPTPSR